MRRVILILMIVTGLVAGCTRAALTPLEYVSWVEDEQNGLCVQKTIAGHEFVLQYKPVDYEVIRQHRVLDIAEADFKIMKGDLEGLQYFTLTIVAEDHQELAASGRADEIEYAERLNYMVSEMQYDVELVDGNDTLPCVFFHAERNFNVTPENNILLAFEKKTGGVECVDKTLIYMDRILKCGPIMITVEADDLEDIPELKFPE